MPLAIVRWYAERSDYVAKAQVQGRTVLLNINANTFAVPHDGAPADELAAALNRRSVGSLRNIVQLGTGIPKYRGALALRRCDPIETRDV